MNILKGCSVAYLCFKRLDGGARVDTGTDVDMVITELSLKYDNSDAESGTENETSILLVSGDDPDLDHSRGQNFVTTHLCFKKVKSTDLLIGGKDSNNNIQMYRQGSLLALQPHDVAAFVEKLEFLEASQQGGETQVSSPALQQILYQYWTQELPFLVHKLLASRYEDPVVVPHVNRFLQETMRRVIAPSASAVVCTEALTPGWCNEVFNCKLLILNKILNNDMYGIVLALLGRLLPILCFISVAYVDTVVCGVVL